MHVLFFLVSFHSFPAIYDKLALFSFVMSCGGGKRLFLKEESNILFLKRYHF